MALVAILAIAVSPLASAQDATPPPDASCQDIEPRDAEILSSFEGASQNAASNEQSTPPTDDGVMPLPEGGPADEETVAEITQTYATEEAMQSELGDVLDTRQLDEDQIVALVSVSKTPHSENGSTQRRHSSLLQEWKSRPQRRPDWTTFDG